MAITISFNKDEDADDLKQMLSASDAFQALSQIRQDIFRPARKHGYSHPSIVKILDDWAETAEAGKLASRDDLNHFVSVFVGGLEEVFADILSYQNINTLEL
ncbi:MAG: hypothetical protein M3Q07_21145 [Pseudobdellovibrionaceae bacterium]|nr:hypothetical protein [Pseudobdellovibrionaceae bacterium]